ncbi:MAG TPA: PilZ domain-containing protein [Blastocatellia bacterium]|nr:PilZ domain-containing protein [Blastocatellia bacterium]
MSAHLTSTAEADADLAQGYHHSEPQALEGAGYSAEDLSAYYYELECLLIKVEKAETHYEALGIDYLSTNGEIIAAYSKPMILLDPATYGLDTELPPELGDRVARASARVLEAFNTLMDFDERLKYDARLFGWENNDSKQKEKGQRRRISKDSRNKKKDADRRSRERFELTIPVLVTGYDENASDWHEAGQSVDLSRAGGCILLRRRVLVGNILYLRMPMPVVLRSHEYLDQTYGTYAVVRWVRPPKDGFRLVGLQFIGELPPLGFQQRPWATFHVGAWDGADRRSEPRESVSEAVDIEYFDESERLIKKDSGFIENISTSGVRVCAEKPPLEADLIRIIRPKVSLSVFALVRNRFTGRDGYERLCTQFIGGCSQQHD